jgi:zinc transporter ZupT
LAPPCSRACSTAPSLLGVTFVLINGRSSNSWAEPEMLSPSNGSEFWSPAMTKKAPGCRPPVFPLSSYMFVIDYFVPHIRFGEQETRGYEKPVNKLAYSISPLRRYRHRRAHLEARIVDKRLLRTGLLLATGITIHNIPESIAVGAGYMHMPKFGIFVAMAIMLHNIPAGIATALPLCRSGLSKLHSFRAWPSLLVLW